MNRWLHDSRFVIYQKGKEKVRGHFDQIQVCDDGDNKVEIDFDCTQGEGNGSFALCSMTVEEAELLVFRLNQVIAKIKNQVNDESNY